jgi:hypothetical protein
VKFIEPAQGNATRQLPSTCVNKSGRTFSELQSREQGQQHQQLGRWQMREQRVA